MLPLRGMSAWPTPATRSVVRTAATVLGSLLLAAFAFPWAELWWKVLGYARGMELGELSAGRYAEISYRELHRVSILESQLISDLF